MTFKLDLTSLEPVSKAPYPFTPLQLEWLEALESGNYKQGEGYLCTPDNRYCCLGVLAELAGAEKKLPEGSYKPAYDFKLPEDPASEWARGSLSFRLREKALFRSALAEFSRSVFFPGLDYGTIVRNADYMPSDAMELFQKSGHTSLAAMNDCRIIPDENGDYRGFNFLEIAQYIRHDPWNVFVAPLGNAQAVSIEPSLAGGG